MLVVGERETARDPHLLDRGDQGRVLVAELGDPLVQQSGVNRVGVRHLFIVRSWTRAKKDPQWILSLALALPTVSPRGLGPFVNWCPMLDIA